MSAPSMQSFPEAAQVQLADVFSQGVPMQAQSLLQDFAQRLLRGEYSPEDFVHTLFTAIFCYAHPDGFDPERVEIGNQVLEKFEVLCAAFCGKGIFHKRALSYFRRVKKSWGNPAQ